MSRASPSAEDRRPRETHGAGAGTRSQVSAHRQSGASPVHGPSVELRTGCLGTESRGGFLQVTVPRYGPAAETGFRRLTLSDNLHRPIPAGAAPLRARRGSRRVGRGGGSSAATLRLQRHEATRFRVPRPACGRSAGFLGTVGDVVSLSVNVGLLTLGPRSDPKFTPVRPGMNAGFF